MAEGPFTLELSADEVACCIAALSEAAENIREAIVGDNPITRAFLEERARGFEAVRDKLVEIE